MTGDSEDPNDRRQYHLDVAPEDVADSVLLPGDPDRLETIVETWDHAEQRAEHREYRTATGEHDGTPVSVTSTGIGSPSTAIAVEELARVGVDTLIRVGSCGSIAPRADIGELVITTAAVRKEGTSKEYVREDYPASADHRITSALVAAAEKLGYTYHLGVTCSTDSFYAGQSRPGLDGFRARDSEAEIDALREAGVVNFEMEAASLLTLANIYGLRAGAVCTVYADRDTGEFRTDGERKAAQTASLAVTYLERMDAAVAASDSDQWHAGLSIER